MIIIDSLLQFKFFLSGEVQENLSLFGNQSSANSMALPSGSLRIASTRRTVDWYGTWRTERAIVFA